MRANGFWVLVVVWALPLAVAAQELRFAGGSQVSMIELYTSQGCNSCPPAEARLNDYVDHPQLWHRYVPLAFHVDYWDNLGWKDRFADPRHSSRQRAYAARGRLSTVYTPAFVVNGREWRPGRFAVEPEADRAAADRLRVRVSDGQVYAQLEAAGNDPQDWVLNVALLGMGLATDIRAGENAGRHSRHEFVVLQWTQVRGRGPQLQAPLPAPGRLQAPRHALAVWLNRPGDPTPRFAAGTELPPALLPGLSSTPLH